MEWLGYAALLLICPIAMMFMMRGMGHGGGGQAHGGADPLAGMSEEQLRELTRRAQDEIEQRETHARSGDGS